MNKLTGGTPKTLREAIENGYLESRKLRNRQSTEEETAPIESAVVDFLAQKFGVVMLESGDIKNGNARDILQELFDTIKAKKAG